MRIISTVTAILLLFTAIFSQESTAIIPQLDCSEPIDIFFALDASDSLTSQEFNSEKTLVIQLLQRLIDAGRDAQAGFLTFTQTINNVQNFDESLFFVQFYLNGVIFDREGTSLLAPITYVYEEIFNPTNAKLRENSRKLFFLITDGMDEDSTLMQLTEISRLLEGRNVTIVIMGIGELTSTEQLSEIASMPHEQNLLLFSDLDEALANVSSIIDRTCTIPVVTLQDVTVESSTSVTITWLPYTFASVISYRICLTLEMRECNISIDGIDPSLNNITVENLVPNTTYSVSVFAFTNLGVTPTSNIIQALTLVPTLAPTFDGFSNVEATSFTVNWIPPQEESQNEVITLYVIDITGDLFPYTGPALNLTTDGTYPDVASKSLNITGLEEFNEYTISIAAVNSEGTGPYTAGDIQRTNQAAPFTSPQSLVLSLGSEPSEEITVNFYLPQSIHQNGVLINYTVIITGTIVDRRTSDRTFTIVGYTYPDIIPISTSVSGLDAYNEYNISVFVINSAGSSPITDVEVITTAASVPDAPPTLNLFTDASTTNFTINWSPPPPLSQNGVITMYTINITGYPFPVIGSPLNFTTDGSYPATANVSLDITGLEEYNEYTVRIAAVNSVGTGTYSVSDTQQTLDSVPGSPLLISANVLNATTVSVVWRPPTEIEQNGIITAYEVVFSSIGNLLPDDVRTVPFSEPHPISEMRLYTEEFNGLEEGIRYRISVRARTSAGVGLPSESAIRLMTPISAPPNLPPFDSNQANITSITSNSITVSLPDVSAVFLGGNLTGFTCSIQGFLPASSIFSNNRRRRNQEYVFITNIIIIITGPGNVFTFTDLLPNFIYVINVSANNEAGTSGAVQLVMITLQSELPSGAPIGFETFNVSSNDVSYTWDNNLTTINGILLGYNLYYAEEGQNPIQISFPVSTLGPYTYVLTQLTPNTRYSFFLSVVNDIGEGPNSTLIWETTDPVVPESTLQPLPSTESPATESSGMIEIRVPTQNSFPTVNIAVIYIIADKTNPPLFTTLSLTAAYNQISSGTSDNVVIQAALGGEYFDQDATYFLFTVGDGKETNYNGNPYINYPLSPGTSYELSYYILFYDENGDVNAQFSMIAASASVMTAPNQRFCVECVVVSVTVTLILILLILVVVLLLVLYWYTQRKAVRKTINTPVKQMQLGEVNKKTTEKDVENVYTNSHTKEDVITEASEI